MTKLIQVAHLDGGVWRITLDRAAKRNALSVEMCRQLEDALDVCTAEGARVILLDAEGPVFSAGADLDEPDFHTTLYPAFERLFARIQRAPMPVVAYINGPAIGAGMLLAMACDIRWVGPAEKIFFSLPVAKMAIGVDAATLRTLELLVGGSWARRITLAGEALLIDDALRAGFVARVGDTDAAVESARGIARQAPLTMRNIKMELAHSSAQPFGQEERHEAREAAWLSHDNAEARQARAEKRPPEFDGR